MTVGFVHVGTRDAAAPALALIASVRAAMPGVAIVQMTDVDTAKVVGVDRCIRRPAGPLALATLEHYSACAGDWLLVDTDVVVQRDVRSVFKRSFAIAVASRDGTMKEREPNSKFMARMPFNKGVVFSRAPEFWAAAAGRLRSHPARQQEWMGDQIAMNEVIASGAFPVHVLSADYNYPPRRKDEDVRMRAILHYKGSRKAWLTDRGAA